MRSQATLNLYHCDNLPSEGIQITTNYICRWGQASGGRDFDGWTNMKQREVSEILSGSWPE
jgi:hypothetical protein